MCYRPLARRLFSRPFATPKWDLPRRCDMRRDLYALRFCGSGAVEMPRRDLCGGVQVYCLFGYPSLLANAKVTFHGVDSSRGLRSITRFLNPKSLAVPSMLQENLHIKDPRISRMGRTLCRTTAGYESLAWIGLQMRLASVKRSAIPDGRVSRA